MEIWKDIPGYEGLYQVSDMGRVKRLSYTATLGNNTFLVRERILIPRSYHKAGHVCVGLYKNGNGINKGVHQLVMATFVGACPEGMEIRHLDSNPRNNSLENLAYGTRYENCIDKSKLGHCGSQKLIPKDVLEIRKRLANGEAMTVIAKDYGVTKEAIYAIKHRKSYAWLEG